jgi:GDP-L-fucose synthase
VARAILFMMENYNSNQFINIGCGTDVSIKELAETIAQKTGFKGTINWDSSKPNGMLRKCMDVSRMKALGFEPSISLEQGIEQMIQIYKNLKNNLA